MLYCPWRLKERWCFPAIWAKPYHSRVLHLVSATLYYHAVCAPGISEACPTQTLTFPPVSPQLWGWRIDRDGIWGRMSISHTSYTSILSLMEYGGWESYPGLSMHCPVHTSWQVCEVITGVITPEERGSEKESYCLRLPAGLWILGVLTPDSVDLSTNTVICILGHVKCPWVPEWWFHNMSDIKVVMTECHRSLYSHYRIGFLVLLVLKELLVDSESHSFRCWDWIVYTRGLREFLLLEFSFIHTFLWH